MTYCDDCGSEHLGPRCGMTFAQRMRTVQLDRASLETRTKVNYYDREGVSDVFGADSKEQMTEETNGLGYARTAKDGRLYHRDRKSGDVKEVTDTQLDQQYLGGRTEREVDAAGAW